MPKGVGIYIGRNEVIAVSAVRTAAGPQVLAFSNVSITEDVQEPAVGKEAQKLRKVKPEARAILKALKEIKEPGAFVNVAVTPLQVVTRHFLMPVVPKKDEASAVRNEASRYVPFKVADSSMDYCARLTHKNVMSITATAIRNEVLESYQDHLRAASAKVLAVEPVYNAVGRAFSALNLVGKAKVHGFVVLQSDGNVNVTLISKGIVYLSRDFLLSGKIEGDKKRFYDELKASMDYFYKLTGGEAISQIFLAGSGDLSLWVEYLEHVFNYAIRFDVANLPHTKELPPEKSHAVLVAFGLALRSLGYQAPMSDIQLLPPKDRRSDPFRLFRFIGLGCLAIFLLFALIRLVVFQPFLMYLEGKKDAILGPADEQFRDLATQSFEDLTVQRNNMNEKVQRLSDFLNDKSSPVHFLISLGQGLPRSIRFDYVSLQELGGEDVFPAAKRKKRLNIRGTCYLGSAQKEAEATSTWIKSLSGKKVFADAFADLKLEEINRGTYRDREVTQFRLLGE